LKAKPGGRLGKEAVYVQHDAGNRTIAGISSEQEPDGETRREAERGRIDGGYGTQYNMPMLYGNVSLTKQEA
jgi:hypothetical protein